MASLRLLHELTLLLCAGLCCGQQLILPDTLNAELGRDVMFIPLSLPSQPYVLISWVIGPEPIVTIVGEQTIVSTVYANRTSVDYTTLALELRNLTSKDEGVYTLNIQLTNTIVNAATTLKIFEPVSNVTITPSETELVEFNSTVSLACSASGSAVSFYWWNGDSEVTVGGRFQLTDENRTLTINGVHRVDTGPYRCEALNIISIKKSPPLNLIIYYGPENVSIKVNPDGPFYGAGSNLVFTCSADSSPAAEFLWEVDGLGLSETGPELKLTNIQAEHAGSYTCIVYNTKSLRYSTSQPISIIVLEKISEVTISGPTFDLIEDSSSFNLTCKGTGTIFSTEWTKDDQKLFPSSRISFSADNSSVMISTVDRTDSGVYRCYRSNPISNHAASYAILINYGPDKVVMDAPREVEEGNAVTLKCIADSVPEAVYTWEFNGTETSETTNSFTVQHVNFSHNGNYTCLAWNHITRRESTSSHILVVIEQGSGGEGGVLSPEVIAGIVIGVLLGVALVVGLVIFFKKIKKRSKSGLRGDKQNGATQNGAEHELHYANVRQFKNDQSVVNMAGSSTQTRQGTPAMVRANLSSRGAQNNKGTKPESKTEVIYSDVKK